MSIEENKAIYMGLCEAFDRGEVHRFRDFLAPDYVEHDPSRPDHNREETCQDWESLLARIKDPKTTPVQLVSEGDMLACRFILEVTSTDHRIGAPAGQRGSVECFEIVRTRDGRIVESWGISDRLGLLQKAVEATKAVAQRVYDDVWSKGDVAAAREIFAPTFRRVGPDGSPQTVGPDDYMNAFVIPSRAAFPDLTSTVEVMVVEGEKVAVRSLNRATHRGEWAGVPATGRTISFQAVDFMRISGGQIQEASGLYDVGPIFRQLGIDYGPITGGQGE
jgi:steroid delta-isomerase-like uncharacterized protein